MIPAILALTIINSVVLVVVAVTQITTAEHVTWLKNVLVPWIAAINNKLGLPK